MHISTRTATFLGLSKTDVSIIKALYQHDLLLADIATATKIPRTSLYYSLPQLQERGFIERYKKNKKIYWRMTPEEHIHHMYTDILKDMVGTDGEKALNEISKDSSVTTYIGNKNILNIFREVSNLPSRSRFFGIQPEQSLLQAITKNSIKEVTEINNKIRKKRIIVEGVIHEKGTDSMVNILSKAEGTELLKSFANRSADTVKLPENFLSGTKAEIYIYDNKVAFVNWAEEFAVVIKNKDVCELVQEMFNSTKYLLRKYDQNERIARKLIDLEVK